MINLLKCLLDKAFSIYNAPLPNNTSAKPKNRLARIGSVEARNARIWLGFRFAQPNLRENGEGIAQKTGFFSISTEYSAAGASGKLKMK